MYSGAIYIIYLSSQFRSPKQGSIKHGEFSVSELLDFRLSAVSEVACQALASHEFSKNALPIELGRRPAAGGGFRFEAWFFVALALKHMFGSLSESGRTWFQS